METKSFSISTNTTSLPGLCKASVMTSKLNLSSSLRLDMQRFQVTYHLKAIPEVQEYLNVAFDNSKHHGDLQDLYRRRYVHFQFYNHIPYSSSSKVFWSNRRILRTHPLPAICDNSLVGQLVSNPRLHLHHSNNITGTDHLCLCSQSFFLFGDCNGLFIFVFFILTFLQ